MQYSSMKLVPSIFTRPAQRAGSGSVCVCLCLSVHASDWRHQGSQSDDKTNEYDNVCQIADIYVILLKRHYCDISYQDSSMNS
jgi:hypothetical protein